MVRRGEDLGGAVAREPAQAPQGQLDVRIPMLAVGVVVAELALVPPSPRCDCARLLADAGCLGG